MKKLKPNDVVLIGELNLGIVRSIDTGFGSKYCFVEINENDHNYPTELLFEIEKLIYIGQL